MLIRTLVTTSFLFISTTAFSATLKPFTSVFNAKISGFSIDNTRKLEILPTGKWQVSTTASVLFIAINESSVFDVKGGQVQPLIYQFKRKGLSDSKDAHLIFNYEKKTVTNKLENNPWSLPIPPQPQDPLSLQMQMRLTLLNSEAPPQSFAFFVPSRGDMKYQEWKLLGQQNLKLKDIGTLDTLVYEYVHGNRTTKAWFAKDWDYLTVQINQVNTKDDKSHKITLRKAVLDGRVVKGITAGVY